MAAARTSYDEIAYPSYPLRQTHPGLLAATASLHGLEPALPSKCRVLELGGGDGANLIPLAYAHPESTFLGIDLAPTPVERGRAGIAELGLDNIELRCADIMNLPGDLGEFDYIIAHGLYSWVPKPVRDRILAIARDHLTPHGVAYISYNTYPGCHIRQMLRGMMRYHTRGMPEPRRRIEQARAILKFVSDGQVAPGAFGDVLREELRRTTYVEDEALLFHDDLADVSDPVWFHEFADHAATHRLRFLAEADYSTSDIGHLSPAASDTLQALRANDVIQFEQYLDFLKCRRFRQSLLCRAEAPMLKEPDPRRVPRLEIACEAQPDGAPDLSASVEMTFTKPKDGGSMSIDLPFAKAALIHLSERFPESVRFDNLVAASCKRLGSDDTEVDAEALREILLAGYVAGMVELRAEALRFARVPGTRPEASAVARWQVRNGARAVTNLRHERIKVEDALTRKLLVLLDGTRDRAALLRDLSHASPSHGADQIDQELSKLGNLALLKPS